MKMKVVIFLCLVSAAHCFIFQGGESQRKTVLQTEDEVDVVISDKNGYPVSENAIFEQDGYEVVKPNNRNVCLIKQISDSNACFDEQPLTFEPSSTIQTRCDERPIIVLKATECDDGSDDDQDEGLQKGKRSISKSKCSKIVVSGCTWKYCVRRNIWGKCKEERCSRWVDKIINSCD
ncbi:uncharacterized protein LOC128215021 [Mya arenaria]|uniref:uncharacterized protein LOC128215021 n=1 Tax=Mya arenaria TaxID=6604 RepID=UPI0022E00DA0|nr:uncharacterized protein LOC128215021 [Mya arenaria]